MKVNDVKVLTKAKDLSKFSKAVDIAIEEKKATAIDEKSNLKNKTFKSTTSNPITFKPQHLSLNNLKSNENTNEKIIACSYCKRTGHDRDKRHKDKEQIRTFKEIESSNTNTLVQKDGDEYLIKMI